ncbi:hypothetical protein OC861_000188 [Tilletia horrida]|nr:hypothetical protein OC861_000188 [Tilletia horrida]
MSMFQKLKDKWEVGRDDKFRNGIGGGPAGGGPGGGGGGGGGGAAMHHHNAFTSGDVDEDRVNRLNAYLRGAQIFFAFVSLCILIAIAIFQGTWVGGASGLTGLLLFITISTMLSSIALLAIPTIAERTEYRRCHGAARALKEARVGLVCNGLWVVLLLIISLAQTISAYTSAGCKDPSKDPHATTSKGDKGAFQSSLPGFCRNKRALAAFLWFDWVAWLLSLLLFMRSWRLARKNGPRVPPFVHPTDDSAFEPVHAGEDEDDLYSRYDGQELHTGKGYDDDRQSNYNSAYDAGGRGYAGEDTLSGIAAKYGLGAGGYGRDTYDNDDAYYRQQQHQQQHQQQQHRYGQDPPRLPEMSYEQRYR